jgi:hypothetical protein
LALGETFTVTYTTGGSTATAQKVGYYNAGIGEPDTEVYLLSLPYGASVTTFNCESFKNTRMYFTDNTSLYKTSTTAPAGFTLDENLFFTNGQFLTPPVAAEAYRGFLQSIYWNAGFTLPTQNVNGYFANFRTTDNIFHYIFVQISTNSGGTLDTDGLDAAIALVTGENADNWYHSDDRYNGNYAYTISPSATPNGFWAALNAPGGPLDVAQGSLGDQPSVDAATDALSAAIGKLIPKVNVNSTALYEKITDMEAQVSENQNELIPGASGAVYKLWLSAYSDYSADNYRAALSNAKALLASLYNTDGSPTADNIAANQHLLDEAASALQTALFELVPKSDDNAVQTYQQSILALNGLFPMAENNGYTGDSWSAFTSARTAAGAYSTAHPVVSLKYSEVLGYRNVLEAYWRACYNLTPAGSAAVSLRLADTGGAIYPANALADFSLANYNASVNLDSGTGYTLKALLTEAGITLPAEGTGLGGFAATWVVYVNGVLLRSPVFYDTDNAMSVLLEDSDSLVDWNDVTLRGGDEVTLSRVNQPVGWYYVSPINAYFKNLTSNFGQLRFTDTAAKTAKEGQALSFTVERKLSYLLTLSGYTARPGAELVVYGPRNSDGSYPAAPVRTGFITNANGTAQLTLDTAGTYLLTAVDGRADDSGSNLYPGLQTAAAPVIVTITPLSGTELQTARASALTRLEAVWADYSEDILGGKWSDAQAAYADARAAVNGAASLSGMNAAVSGLTAQLSDLRNQAERPYFLDLMANYLAALPTKAQVEADNTLLTQDDGQLIGVIKSIYDSATPYQQSQLTVAQSEQYNAVIAKWGTDGTALPQSITYNVTVRFEPQSLKDRLPTALLQYYTRTTGINTVPGDNITADTFPINPSTQGIGAIYGIPAKTSQYILSSFRVQGGTYDNIYNLQPSDMYIELGISVLPREDITITFTGRDLTTDVTLDQTKSDARDALALAYAGYVKADYSNASWAQLTGAYNSGLAAITAAADAAAVNSARAVALATMDTVQTLKESGQSETAGKYGSVRVTVENTTYPGGPFYGEGSIVSNAEVPLNDGTTMMTAILDALQRDGYHWTGTGGSSPADATNITYLSGINNGVQSLSEFDGGPPSGWMGTLNDWFVNESFQSFRVNASNKSYRLVDGDQIRVMYTSTGLGTDLGGTWSTADTSLKELTYGGGSLMPAFGSGTLNYILKLGLDSTTASFTPVAANKSYQVRTYLNTKTGDNWYRRGEPITVKPGDVVYIGIGDRSWPSMNNQGAEAIPYTGIWYTVTIIDSGSSSTVIAMINKLAVITYVNYKVQSEQVSLARAAYEALTQSAKQDVANYAKLTAAEAQLEFFGEIQSVKDLLSTLKNSGQMSDAQVLAAKAQIEAADAAYKALTPEQQKYITVGDVANYNKLVERLKKLTTTTAGTITGSDKEPGAGTVLTPAVTATNGTAAVTLGSSDLADAIKGAKDNGGTITIAPEITGTANKVTVDLPKASLSDIASQTGADLTVQTPEGSVTIPNGALGSIVSQAAGGTVTVSLGTVDASSLTEAQQTAAGGNPVYDISILSGGTHITIFGGAGITVSLPYTLKAGEDLLNVTVWYLDNSGKLKQMTASYDKATGLATFTTTHLSKYFVKYDAWTNPYDDVKSADWLYDAVKYVSKNSLMSGMTATAFEPNAGMTRAMLVTVLYRLDGKPAITGTNSFTDVKNGQWYTDAVLWANKNNIVTGYGGGLFGTNDSVTREQMAAILYNYTKYKGYDMTKTADLGAYADVSKLSAWATKAVKWAVAEGLITGTSTTALSPGGNASRAQVAAILMRFCVNFID